MVEWRIRSFGSFGRPREGRGSSDGRSTKFLIHENRQWEVSSEWQIREP